MSTIERFNYRIIVREWGREIIIAETPYYLGKMLTYDAGKAGGLQYHVEKDETFYLYSGRGWIVCDDGTGILKKELMLASESVHIPAGAVHQFQAITECVGFEVSTPHYDDRVRVEDRYGVPVIGDGPGLPTTWPKVKE